jgi:hypothetical protein
MKFKKYNDEFFYYILYSYIAYFIKYNYITQSKKDNRFHTNLFNAMSIIFG